MKKIALLSLALILALGTLGVGYALWSENLYIEGYAETGDVNWEFYNPYNPGSEPIFTHDDQGLDPPLFLKDVAWKDISFSDADGDGDYDIFWFTINNAYPGYANHGSFWVHCNGSVPIHLESFIMTYNGQDYDLGINAGSWVTTADGAFEILWGDEPGTQLHFCESKNISFTIRVLQPALQNHQYTFSITLNAVQYNESQFP